MSVVHREKLTGLNKDISQGYIEDLIASSRQDYLELYEKSIEPSHKELLEWEDLYMHQLREHGEEAKAADFMAIRFLLWANEGIEKNGADVVRIPAVDTFFRNVNDRMRVHLNGFIADANGVDMRHLEVPLIDWSDQSKYIPYASDAANLDTIGYLLGRNNIENDAVIAIGCEYLFGAEKQQICGVNYHFTPVA